MLLNALQSGFSGFDISAFITRMLLSIPPFLLALSVHEAAHGWMAERCGDPTARYLGRVTLNPIAHIDPIGLAMLFIAGFGWAKPVPVNPNNFRNYRKDDLKVSLAGVTANLLMFAVGCVILYGWIAFALSRLPDSAWYEGGFLVKVDELLYGVGVSDAFLYAGQMGDFLIGPFFGKIPSYLFEMLVTFTTINLVLAAFNLLPVPPLDGYHVLNDLLLRRPLFAPQKAAMVGQMALLLLVVTGTIGRLLGGLVNGVMTGAGTAFEALFRALRVI
jgi:Zn-dependent protease